MRYLFIAGILTMVTACSTHDEQYYRGHPQALQKALGDCPARQPSGVSCETLADIALQINELAFQLQMNPQGFGKKILSLQENLAKQRIALQADNNQSELKTTIEKNEQQLAEHLAVVRWLESPES
ncbi:hypothetical protein [Legionella fairfieldensis]|uniref:hypothetical protein n=1 Tax=Legionella fairfieldensis TaxID=45064 RepID=UPI0004900E68|nr:hypothetical protein [Legionella fairfieldensis]